MKPETVQQPWNQYDHCFFEKGFPDIGGWAFSKVYKERPKFVEFALCWQSASGTYALWKKYCELRNKNARKSNAAES